MGFLSFVCVCGHVVEEHERGFLNPCEIPGCECLDFEADDSDEETEER